VELAHGLVELQAWPGRAASATQYVRQESKKAIKIIRVEFYKIKTKIPKESSLIK
jgi:hypothetical protein